MTSVARQFATGIKSLIDPIIFAGSTLGSLNMVKLYQKSVKDKPITEINIFRGAYDSIFHETRLNKEPSQMIIRVRSNAESREEDAQEDLDFLVEQIVAKLRVKTDDSAWRNTGVPGFLDTDNIKIRVRNYKGNYFTRDIVVDIIQYVPSN